MQGETGQIWGALDACPEMGVNIPSCNLQALLWVRWVPQTEGNCENYKLKPDQRLTAYESCFTTGNG